MTIFNSMDDALKPVTILNSGDFLARYPDVPKAERAENDSMTIETLLRSIDGRLQTMDGRLDSMDQRLDNMDRRLDNMDKRLDMVSEDIVELKVQTAAVGARLIGVEKRLDRAEDRYDRQEIRQREADERLIHFEANLERLPSWKSVGATSATVTAGCCGLFVWLAEGGAKTVARFFE